ncbi:MAG: choice-of-anchor I family protein [Pseudomonadales bacterium]|nr:choice-of-anchor I family protein [Pseudomonadales bacterium]
MPSQFVRTTLAAAILGASSLVAAAPPVKSIGLELLGTYSQPDPAAAFDESATEISAFDPRSQQLFVTNGADGTLDVLDLSDPTAPALVRQIDVSGPLGSGTFIGDGANSVAVYRGIVAAAVQADPVTDPGAVALFDTDGNLLNLVAVGALPDMLTFTDDGRFLLVANEGEPDEGVDPEGSVSVIDLRRGVLAASARTADFNAFDSQAAALKADGVRLFPDVLSGDLTVSQDLEPEYIAADPRGRTALVTLQEANSVALLDIYRARITAIVPLGTKDHSLAGNGLDVSDDDEQINIDTWPLRGLYMPDAIAAYQVRGKTYYVTANEGDDRGDADEEGRGDVIRLKDYEDVISFGRSGLAATAEVQALAEDEQLRRVNISTIDGINEDGELAELYSYGGRSFSIWSADGELVWDSGDALEQITAAAFPDNFNASNTGDEIDNRSDNKGPEAEAVTIASLWGRTYAFIGLERIGGVVIYDIGNPRAPQFVDYINNRSFIDDDDLLEAHPELAGDLGPESLLVIPTHKSPTRQPLLVVANEVSGTTSVFKIVKAGKSRKK